MADIPGIIEGASEGKGLGLRFLRHIERNAVLLFMVPADAANIREQYEILLRELEQFTPDLVDKPRVLAISKSDLLDDELIAEMQKELPDDLPHVFISAGSGMGISALKDMLWSAITDESNRIEGSSITHRPLDGHHRVREEDEFIFQLPEEETAPELEDDTDETDWDEAEWEYDDPEK